MRRIGKQLAASLFLALLWLAQPVSGQPDRVTTSHEAETTVSVRDVKASHDMVSGSIMNSSHRPLREVRLLIRHAWLWKNERHPGYDNPGRTERYVFSTEVPAGGSAPFTYMITPPLPDRNDGHFVTTVEVVGFTEVGF